MCAGAGSERPATLVVLQLPRAARNDRDREVDKRPQLRRAQLFAGAPGTRHVAGTGKACSRVGCRLVWSTEWSPRRTMLSAPFQERGSGRPYTGVGAVAPAFDDDRAPCGRPASFLGLVLLRRLHALVEPCVDVGNPIADPARGELNLGQVGGDVREKRASREPDLTGRVLRVYDRRGNRR